MFHILVVLDCVSRLISANVLVQASIIIFIVHPSVKTYFARNHHLN